MSYEFEKISGKDLIKYFDNKVSEKQRVDLTVTYSSPSPSVPYFICNFAGYIESLTSTTYSSSYILNKSESSFSINSEFYYYVHFDPKYSRILIKFFKEKEGDLN